MGWKSSQQTHCAACALRELNVARSQVLHYVGGGVTYTITLTSKVLLLAVYYSNQSSLNAARCNSFNKRWDMQNGMCQCFQWPQASLLPVTCGCHQLQLQSESGSSKCSWSGCHTASAGTRWNLFERYHTNSQRGDTWHGVEDDSLQGGKSYDKDHDGNNNDNDVGDRW